jgi:hypothetical protein
MMVPSGKLALPVGVDRYIVAQDRTKAVEVACFMGRGNPLPVAVPMRDFGNEDRGGFSICVSWCRGKEGDKAGYCCNCAQEECEVFHKGSSIQYA